jgi:hypothetical protein
MRSPEDAQAEQSRRVRSGSAVEALRETHIEKLRNVEADGRADIVVDDTVTARRISSKRATWFAVWRIAAKPSGRRPSRSPNRRSEHREYGCAPGPRFVEFDLRRIQVSAGIVVEIIVIPGPFGCGR